MAVRDSVLKLAEGVKALLKDAVARNDGRSFIVDLHELRNRLEVTSIPRRLLHEEINDILTWDEVSREVGLWVVAEFEMSRFQFSPAASWQYSFEGKKGVAGTWDPLEEEPSGDDEDEEGSDN